MKFSLTSPPDTLCILRLSALGDITHVLPTLRTLQTHWPNTQITWIIGKTEYQLVKHIENVNFIIFDKTQGFQAYLNLKRQIKDLNDNNAFDILLHMQLSIRASVASLFIPAKIKLGFDKARAKDMQSLFCNHAIKPLSTRQHVVDSFLEFPRFFGLAAVKKWMLPVSESATQSVQQVIGSNNPCLVINPCAVAKAKNWRNWTASGYAEIADYVHDKYQMQVVLSGGNSEIEQETANEILSLCKHASPINLIAKTTIDEMVALLNLAEIVIAPDTGPVHIASSLHTKTIGLYATTNPERAGPYNYLSHTANRYPDALQQYYGETVDTASWGKRIKTAEGMKLITVDDVKLRIDQFM